ncbi:MAG: hypothetical protein KDI09_08460, partial [Halioglobus sp.]|nr:hypothetical protein [Halioglobus sp.]
MFLARILVIGLLLQAATALAFTGTESCVDCHAEEHENWRGSHHDLAMQAVTPDTVLGDFD